MERHLAVVLASLGVFVAVILGVKLAPHLHVVLLHLALVEAHVGNLLRVGTPLESLGDGELFLVDPVGGAVDNLVHLAVSGDGMLLERGEVHPVEVVVAHKGHLGAVGAKGGEALLAVVADFSKGFALNIVDVVVRDAAVAVEGFKAATEENLLLVGAELVAFHRGQGLGLLLHVGAVEEAHVLHFLAGGVVVFGDARAAHGAVVLAVSHRTDGSDAFRTEGPLGPDVLQRDIFGLRHRYAHATNHCKCQYNKQFLHFW